uniref:Uncharacterized protein n=1 Tax=Myotis myotis TaxID=51298 RepID=A0A7J7TTS4_MYOMY|nr:hypothetical protein mMyoMyo1_008992 [Myotis myotis]
MGDKYQVLQCPFGHCQAHSPLSTQLGVGEKPVGFLGFSLPNCSHCAVFGEQSTCSFLEPSFGLASGVASLGESPRSMWFWLRPCLGFYISDPFLATSISSGPLNHAKGNKNDNNDAVTVFYSWLTCL